MLIASGFKVLDADLVARQVLIQYPEILDKVRIEFGEGFFDWRGEFRRKEFGNHIFRFPKLRVKYENIIIPYIKKEINLAFERYEQNGVSLVILDAPTLIENNLHEVPAYSLKDKFSIRLPNGELVKTKNQVDELVKFLKII